MSITLDIKGVAETHFRLIATEQDGTKTDLGKRFRCEADAERTKSRYLATPEKLAGRVAHCKEIYSRPVVTREKQQGSVTIQLPDGTQRVEPLEIVAEIKTYPGTDRRDCNVILPGPLVRKAKSKVAEKFKGK